MPIRELIKYGIRDLGCNALGLQLSKVTPLADIARFFSRVVPLSMPLVRIGGQNDGGYLLPDDIAGIRTCFSPGVGAFADFELALVERGIQCFLADYSVEVAPVSNPLIHFQRKYLGVRNNERHISLESWVDACAENNDTDLLLQMDIEGSEYSVILSTPDVVLSRFRIMVIEFHMLNDLINPTAFRLIDAAFEKLLAIFEIVHIHPNNCGTAVRYGEFSIHPLLEITLLRKDRVMNAKPTRSFPHALDRPNSLSQPDVTLHRCWYR